MVIGVASVDPNATMEVDQTWFPQESIVNAWHRLHMNFLRLRCTSTSDLQLQCDRPLTVDDLRFIC